MRSRLARHAIILSLVVAAVAAGGVAQSSAGADTSSVPAAIAALLR